MRRDEVVAQSALDDAHHLAREPPRVERRREELVVRVLHRVAHLRRDLGWADDRRADARGVVAAQSRFMSESAEDRRELGDEPVLQFACERLVQCQDSRLAAGVLAWEQTFCEIPPLSIQYKT